MIFNKLDESKPNNIAFNIRIRNEGHIRYDRWASVKKKGLVLKLLLERKFC
jgi:hypothetical protein